jgi:predicted Zn-dependent peptidase
VYRVTTLPNGLRVATARMPHMASVSLGVWVGVGGRHEPAEWNGLAHFIEHMLFKGTRRRTAAEISEAVEGIGGYLNAFTSEEHTCIYARARHDRLEELLDVILDMYLDSELAPREIAKEREVIKEELAMYLDQPSQHVHELLNATVWPDQPLGRPLTGTTATLDGFRRHHFARFLSSHYVVGSTLIAAAGNLVHDRLVLLVRRMANRFRPGPQPAFTPAESQQTRPAVRLHTKATEQTQVALGLRTCSRHDERRFALRLLNVVLGENMSSRLFQTLREDRGLAYSIYSSVSFWDDVGDLVVSAGLDTATLPKALKLIVRELSRLAEKPPAAAEFARARDYVLGQIDLGLESTESHMMAVGEQMLGYGRIFPVAEMKRRLGRVTPAEVQAAARDFFRPDRASLALVSPRRQARDLERLLAW